MEQKRQQFEFEWKLRLYPNTLIPLTREMKDILLAYPDLINKPNSKFFAEFHRQIIANNDEGLYLFAGSSHVEIKVPEHVRTIYIYVMNKSKVVIDFNTLSQRIKLVNVYLYDEAEAYVDASNGVTVSVKYLSPRAECIVKSDDSCTDIESVFNEKGQISATKEVRYSTKRMKQL